MVSIVTKIYSAYSFLASSRSVPAISKCCYVGMSLVRFEPTVIYNMIVDAKNYVNEIGTRIFNSPFRKSGVYQIHTNIAFYSFIDPLNFFGSELKRKKQMNTC